MTFTLNVNGTPYEVDVDPQKPLLWVLREDIGLTGTKFGCGIGKCGACTVLIDGAATRSCILAVSSAADKQITTIQGLSDDLGNAIKDAWISDQVSQCGYCQPGQILKAYDLLSKKLDPSDGDIEEAMTNLCRCGTYQRIRTAIKKAAQTMQQKRGG